MIHQGVTIPNFRTSEFSENPHKYASGLLMQNLQKTRTILDAKMYPSKRRGALARFDKKDRTSMHYANDAESSTALDWFTELPAFEAWGQVLHSGLWDGVGIYFDTKDNEGVYRPMFHTDIGRDTKLLWMRSFNPVNNRNEYTYSWRGAVFWGKLLAHFNVLKGGV